MNCTWSIRRRTLLVRTVGGGHARHVARVAFGSGRGRYEDEFIRTDIYLRSLQSDRFNVWDLEHTHVKTSEGGRGFRLSWT